MITNIEIMTVIPAIAIFTSTGNTFTDYHSIYLDKLHSSIGFGFRFGLSRSAGTIVNHINFSWPLDNSMEGPSISIYSKKKVKSPADTMSKPIIKCHKLYIAIKNF